MPARKFALASVDATCSTLPNAFLASANLLAFKASIPLRYSVAASKSGVLMLGADDMLPPLLLALTEALVASRMTLVAASAERVKVADIGTPFSAMFHY